MGLTAELRSLVSDLVENHGGGAPFFDALDEEVRRPRYFEELTRLARGYFPRALPVVSGEFGRAYQAWWVRTDQGFTPPLWVPGGLRGKGVSITIDDASRSDEYVFLDDSIYRGRTRDRVDNALWTAGAELVGTIVVYDGTPISTQHIRHTDALYSWKDHTRNTAPGLFQHINPALLGIERV